MSEGPEDPKERAKRFAEHLSEHGHAEHAESVEQALAHETEHAVLVGLRDFCQTLLTWVEAFDPVTMGMAEELRLAVDKELGMKSPEPPESDAAATEK